MDVISPIPAPNARTTKNTGYSIDLLTQMLWTHQGMLTRDWEVIGVIDFDLDVNRQERDEYIDRIRIMFFMNSKYVREESRKESDSYVSELIRIHRSLINQHVLLDLDETMEQINWQFIDTFMRERIYDFLSTRRS